jgi:hypothetical protein
MARVNLAVTKAVQPHVNSFEGVDWDGVQAALTDPHWKLPSGAAVAELFGEGWSEVTATMTEQVQAWRRLDEELIGPQATLRLLTIGGSTGYTRHWWGQGRWNAICRQIVDDAVEAGVPLPEPYDRRGSDELDADLADPDRVSDDVLDWLIGMPQGGLDTARGLRMHATATQPVYRMMGTEN